MTTYRVLGLMSGTSLDGLDIAQCIFEVQEGNWKYAIEWAITYPYDREWKEKLAHAENLSGLGILSLHNEYGRLLGKYVNTFLKDSLTSVDFIASHGHTVFHQPQSGLTFQIGSGFCLAAETGLPVICDFRTLDVALGGQGAPLVPIGDKLLFGNYKYCLNLGGFANISFDDASGRRMAYDVCPVNIVINHLVAERELSFDPDGSIAGEGRLNEKLLDALNDLSFYQQKGPKSLGKEWVLRELLPCLDGFNLSLEDKLRTFYEHIAMQISKTLDKPGGEILVTGGGGHNVFLMELLKERSARTICIPPKEVVDFKEALIFAFLGILKYRNEANCLASVTGAKMDNVGGVMINPPGLQ